MSTWLEPEEAKLFILDFIDLSRESGADRKIEVHVKEALIKQLAKKREVNKSYSETEIVQLANELLRSVIHTLVHREDQYILNCQFVILKIDFVENYNFCFKNFFIKSER